MNAWKRAVAPIFALVAASLVVQSPSPASALPDVLSIRGEAALGLHLTEPQLTYFPVGLGFAGGAEVRPDPLIGFEARFAAYFFPSTGQAAVRDDVGAAYMPGLAVRLHPLPDLAEGDLWISAGGDFVITGDQVFPGLGLGVGFDIEVETMVRMGPFVRYQHVFDVRGLDGVPEAADAGFLQIGLSISLLGKEPERPRPELWQPNDQPLPSGGWHESEPFEHECEGNQDCESGRVCRMMQLGTCQRCPRGQRARVCVDPDHPGEGAE